MGRLEPSLFGKLFGRLFHRAGQQACDFFGRLVEQFHACRGQAGNQARRQAACLAVGGEDVASADAVAADFERSPGAVPERQAVAQARLRAFFACGALAARPTLADTHSE